MVPAAVDPSQRQLVQCGLLLRAACHEAADVKDDVTGGAKVTR